MEINFPNIRQNRPGGMAGYVFSRQMKGLFVKGLMELQLQELIGQQVEEQTMI